MKNSIKLLLRPQGPTQIWQGAESLFTTNFEGGKATREVWNRPQPVLLFPGLGASKLLENTQQKYPPRMYDFLFKNQQWKQEIMNNFHIDTPPLGDIHSLDLSFLPFLPIRNIYKTIINEPNIYPIPYDFRRIDQYDYITSLFGRIKTYIENMNQPVILLGHSTGGMVIHWFLHRQSPEWRRTWINSVVNINVPFGGTVLVLEHCLSNKHLTRFVGKNVIQSLGGSVWNMPITKYINHSVVIDQGREIDDYMSFFELHDVRKRWYSNKHVFDSFSEWTGVKTHIVYSSTNPLEKTATTLLITNSKKEFQTLYGEGDGVVSLSSLLVPKMWNAPPDEVLFKHVPNSGHSLILKQKI
jgi:pimeloyl-ACP methyl ester carboxylesterase